jgi:hypothetical protein
MKIEIKEKFNGEKDIDIFFQSVEESARVIQRWCNFLTKDCDVIVEVINKIKQGENVTGTDYTARLKNVIQLYKQDILRVNAELSFLKERFVDKL